MTTPAPKTSAIIDANLYRVGSATVPSVDISAAKILARWSLSDDTMFGWSAGPTFQFLQLSPEFLPTVGARTHLALAHRFSPNVKFFTSVGVGLHVGMVSIHNTGSVVTEVEGIGHLGFMFPRLFGLPETTTPLIQGIGGVGIFHPESGPLTYTPIYGGGLGVRWSF